MKNIVIGLLILYVIAVLGLSIAAYIYSKKNVKD
jgi:hypothetical protein